MRIKKTGPRPIFHGLAGNIQLDANYHGRASEHNNPNAFENTTDHPDSGLSTLRSLAAPVRVLEEDRALVDETQEQGDGDTGGGRTVMPQSRKREGSILSSQGSESVQTRELQTGCRKRKASFLSDSHTDCQHRIKALESTLHILQSRVKKLVSGLTTRRLMNIRSRQLLDRGESDNSGGAVVFVNYSVKENEERNMAARRPERTDDDSWLQEQMAGGADGEGKEMGENDHDSDSAEAARERNKVWKQSDN